MAIIEGSCSGGCQRYSQRKPSRQIDNQGRPESGIAAAVTWSEVEFWPDGTARITIQKGKNQPGPLIVAVTESTARALRDIQPRGDDLSRPVFGLTGEALANRVRAAARAAGLGDDFSGHSGRIGMARRMVAAGAHRGGAAAGAMEARRYGGPLHPGRVGGRGI